MSIATDPTPTFWAAGACHGIDPDFFHPERGISTAEARAVCVPCPVRTDCLRWALARNERYGVWGGTSERERRRIRRSIADGDPVPELDPEWHPTGRGGRPLTLTPPQPVNPRPKEEPVDLVVAPDPPAALNGKPATDSPTDVCVNCGRRYTPDRRTQRFCRKECARAWYSSHPKGESGKRNPRIRQPKATSPDTAPAATAPPTTTQTEGPVDLEALIAHVLATCDRWAIEADIGDIRISITRGCP